MMVFLPHAYVVAGAVASIEQCILRECNLRRDQVYVSAHPAESELHNAVMIGRAVLRSI
jgi:hypothetical protein